ncbi:MAG: TolC family protein [Acidobacteriia bacterium]|nr:TolC family protein [Terriglobia bacterium]
MTGNRSLYAGVAAAALFLLLISCQTLFAQSHGDGTKVFNLEAAVDFALQNYPAVRASIEQLSAARAGVGLAKTSYLPRADMLWQSNRATRNNIFGLLLPQSVISPVSGPVLPSTSNDSVWGSAAGLLVSWEPFDFGRRGAAVDAARAGQNVANSDLSVTRLDVAVAVTNAFFTVAAARQRVSAAKANVNRRQVLANSVHVLVNNDLRPGADASRADAELARAQILFIQAEQAEAVSRAALAQILGIAGSNLQIDVGSLLSAPPKSIPTAPLPSTHPFAAAEQARVDQIKAREHILDRSYYPRFNLQSTIYGRGSGANTDGTIQTGASGLGLDRYNWGVGLTVTFPLFDIFSIRGQKQIEAANERAEHARYDLTLDVLTGQLQQAQATLDGARLVAEKTPVELQAAREAEMQARARYDAGLANLVEAADAQSLLVQAETDDALARLAVWNDLASVTAAHGDLQPFLQFLHQNTQGGR